MKHITRLAAPVTREHTRTHAITPTTHYNPAHAMLDPQNTKTRGRKPNKNPARPKHESTNANNTTQGCIKHDNTTKNFHKKTFKKHVTNT